MTSRATQELTAVVLTTLKIKGMAGRFVWAKKSARYNEVSIVSLLMSYRCFKFFISVFPVASEKSLSILGVLAFLPLSAL